MPGNLHHDSLFAWFPGYSGVIDAIEWIPGVGPVRAAFAVTIVAGLVAAWGLARLVVLVTGDSRVALITVALWALGPGTIVLAMLYPEAMFCALAAWSLVALVERRWLTAGLLAALSGAVRLSASALAVAIAVAALPEFSSRPSGRERRSPPGGARWPRCSSGRSACSATGATRAGPGTSPTRGSSWNTR